MRQREIERLANHIRHRKRGDGGRIETVGIEAGHVYMDEATGTEHSVSFGIGADLFGALVGLARVRPTAIVFIDDYNPLDGRTLCLHNHLEVARGAGFFQPVEPEGEIFMEADMVPGAEAIIKQLSEQGLTVERAGGIYTAKYKACLRNPDGRLSCAVLDAAFHLERFQRWHFNITVLPDGSERSYRDEQRHVRQILRLLGWDSIPLANIYFQPDGQFVANWQ